MTKPTIIAEIGGTIRRYVSIDKGMVIMAATFCKTDVIKFL